jgi:hypothetical protein
MWAQLRTTLQKLWATPSQWSNSITRLTSPSFANALVELWKVRKESKNCVPITRFLHTNPRRRGRCNGNTKVSSGRVCKPDFVAARGLVAACAETFAARGVTIIPLGPESLRGSSSLPEGRGSLLLRACCVRAGPALPSYLALLHAGFAVPRMLPSGRWALTPPFHPYQMRWTETGGPSVSRWPAAEVFASPAV